METVNTILMLAVAGLSYVTVLKGLEIIKAKALTNRTFLLGIFALIALCCLIPDISFFWRGVLCGIIFWSMKLLLILAEKIGDLPRFTKSELAIMLLSSSFLLGIAFLLGLNVLLTLGIITVCSAILYINYIIKNWRRAKKYETALKGDYETLQRNNYLKRVREEISQMGKEELKRAIVSSKQKLLLSGKKCDCGNCRNSEGLCRYQQTVKFQSTDFIKGCELEEFKLKHMLVRKAEIEN